MTTKPDEYEVGAFYWVIIANDPDAENEWENDVMPARYAGDGRWNYLESKGNDWPTKWREKIPRYTGFDKTPEPSSGEGMPPHPKTFWQGHCGLEDCDDDEGEFVTKLAYDDLRAHATTLAAQVERLKAKLADAEDSETHWRQMWMQTLLDQKAAEAQVEEYRKEIGRLNGAMIGILQLACDADEAPAADLLHEIAQKANEHIRPAITAERDAGEV